MWDEIIPYRLGLRVSVDEDGGHRICSQLQLISLAAYLRRTAECYGHKPCLTSRVVGTSRLEPDQRQRSRLRLLMAQSGGWRVGRACPLCPGISDINLFRYCQSVVDFDAEIPDRAFDLGMPEQELDSPQIARPPIDQGCLCASQ